MNLLVLTSIYPQPDDEKNIGVTPVVKYFCEEWVKQGHNVLVIHNSSYYPKLFYLLPDNIIKKTNSKFGIVIPNKNQSKILNTTCKGVRCYRLPMLKIIPKSIYTEKQVASQFDKIESIIFGDGFKPDIIIGHWENPQIQLIAKMKERWNIKSSLVFHGLVYINQKKYWNYLKDKINSLDVIGARSEAIANELKSIIDHKVAPFICYSGIENRYFHNIDNQLSLINCKQFDSYLFVGRLIKRKNIDSIITVLNKIYLNEEFTLRLIGEGAEKEKLISIVENLYRSDNIKFLGYKDHDEVIEYMAMTEVFIMISDNETFGLVYIEAMSQGCIVVASRHGGMDGIIKDEINGFLCEQGNIDELTYICSKIRDMPKDEKKRIALNAIKTATKFSSSNVAKEYLENIIK